MMNHDNIVAYWTPDQLPEPGKEMNFKYTLTFSRDEDKLHAPDNAWVLQTRRSTGDVKQSNLIRQPDGTIALWWIRWRRHEKTAAGYARRCAN